MWWDAVLRSGQTFDEVIEKELRAARAVVVLWSPRSVRSRWVRAEATLADRSNKLVPIIIEPCELPIIFELTHAAELSEWSGDTTDPRWQALISDLRRMVGSAAERPAAASPPPSPEPVAKSAPPPSPKPAAAEAEQPRKQVRPDSPEAIMAALERLGKSETELAKPTPEEQKRAEFYQRSDEYRAQESDDVHCLLRLDGEEQETRFVVTAVGLKIGRAPPADIIVSGLGVSRSHCLVEYAAGRLRVTDLNSTNGTFVDNKRVDRSAILDVGGVLRVGNVSFEHVVRRREELALEMPLAGFDEDSAFRSAARH